jgi:hypothetical protein
LTIKISSKSSNLKKEPQDAFRSQTKERTVAAHTHKRRRKGGRGGFLAMISHGAIQTLPELCAKAPGMHNQSVRVLGRCDGMQRKRKEAKNMSTA